MPSQVTVSLLGALLLAGAQLSQCYNSNSNLRQVFPRDQGVCHILKPLGCYTTNALSDSPTTSSGMTLNVCSASCSGHVYFGVTDGDECVCGDALGENSGVLLSTQCDEPCTGDASQTCGGSNGLNLYSYAGVSASSTSTTSSSSTATTSDTETTTTATTSDIEATTTTDVTSTTDSTSSSMIITSSSTSTSVPLVCPTIATTVTVVKGRRAIVQVDTDPAVCSGVCVDLLTNNANCGVCGQSCGAGQCVGGYCACPSQVTTFYPTSTVSSGTTVGSTTTTISSMLAKRTRWIGEEARVERLAKRGIMARAPAVMEYQTCDGVQCVDTYNDPLNCGSCLTACNTVTGYEGPLCYMGECVACSYQRTPAAKILKRICPDSIPYCGVGNFFLPIRKFTGWNMEPAEKVYGDEYGRIQGGKKGDNDFAFVNGTVVER